MKTYKNIIDEKLKQYLQPQKPKELYEAMAYTVLLDGKRLRPVFVLEFCKIFSGNFEKAIPTACALEMLHAQSLIYDDLPCMDNDDIRRHKPANHKVFGEAMALMAGDALISFAPSVIIENTEADAQTVLTIVKEFLDAAGAKGIVGGQVADMASENKNISAEELDFIQKYKTATLFEFAAKAGAILGGANEAQTLAAQKFGAIFGKAFQIYDDILDEISTPEEIGKTTGKDKKAGKATYVSIWGLEKAKKDLRFLLNEACDILEEARIKSGIFNEIIASVRTKIGL